MTLYEFDAVQFGLIVAAIASVVQFIKSILEKIEGWEDAPGWMRDFSSWWAHSKGPVILSVLVSLFVTLLPGIVEDGVLTLAEASKLLDALGLAAGANVLFWISRLKSPLNMFKRRE